MTVEFNPKLLDVVEFDDGTSRQRFHGTTVELLGGGRTLIETSDDQGIPLAFMSLPKEDLTKAWEVSNSEATESPIPEAKHYFENGLLFLQNGLAERAKEEFSKSFSIDQRFRGTLLHAANDLGAKSSFDTAIFIYNLLLELSPEYSLARENLAVTFLNRGVAHARNGLIPQAIEEFNQSLMLNPAKRTVETIRTNIVAAYTQLGIFHTKAKQYQLAFQCFQLALELDPSDISRKNLAIAMIAISTIRMEDRSRKDTQAAIFRQPLLMGLGLAQCLTAYGAAVAGLGDLAEARSAFQQALDADPTNPEAAHNLEALSRRDRSQDNGQDIVAGLTSVAIQPPQNLQL